MTRISSAAIAAFHKTAFLLLPALFLMSAILTLKTHLAIALLEIAIAGVAATIWLRVIRTYKEVHSDGSVLLIEDRNRKIVVHYTDIIDVKPMFYLHAPVITITYRTASRLEQVRFVAATDSIAYALVDRSFFSPHEPPSGRS